MFIRTAALALSLAAASLGMSSPAAHRAPAKGPNTFTVSLHCKNSEGSAQFYFLHGAIHYQITSDYTINCGEKMDFEQNAEYPVTAVYASMSSGLNYVRCAEVIVPLKGTGTCGETTMRVSK